MTIVAPTLKRCFDSASTDAAGTIARGGTHIAGVGKLCPIPVSADFWQGSTMEALIEQQGVRPVSDFDALLGGWPENETVDEFLRRCTSGGSRIPVR